MNTFQIIKNSYSTKKYSRKLRVEALYLRLRKDMLRNKYLYIMALPGLIYYTIYHYWPVYGAIIAFKDFSPAAGILGSPWVGFKHFESFFNSYYFTRILKNTIILNIYSLIWAFPAPIILALALNEIRNNAFKRVVQSVSYLPHFISIMVISGLIIDFTSSDGIINYILGFLGVEKSNMLLNPGLFRTIYISSSIWQEVGWGSIIYLSALTGIDQELYQASTIDGAGRFKQFLHVTLPGIMPTIIILLILRLGHMMNIGFEKVFLLYNPATYETSDVISTFVYLKGILEANFSYTTAIGLFNSIINFMLIIISNKISRKMTETSLW